MATFQLHHDASSMDDSLSASQYNPILNSTHGIDVRGVEAETGEGHIICEFCGRRFSSGKAWGGHKRHHLQMKKKKQKLAKLKFIKKKQRCRTIYAGDITVEDGKPICCVCYKAFPSLNSLFRHMRFHPHRDWRGIQPPRIEKGNVSDQRVDLLSGLVGWLKKDKRGRVCISDLIPLAAHNLITLSTWSAAKSGHAKTTDSVRKREHGSVIESALLTYDHEEIETEKNFYKGQALGGHQRCQWKPTRVVSSTGENNVNGKLTLDLNKPYNGIEDGEATNKLFSINAD